MTNYGLTEIKNKPSIIKKMDISVIVDKKQHKTIGYYISAKYEKYILPIIEKIDKQEKLSKLNKLKNQQDLEFA